MLAYRGPKCRQRGRKHRGRTSLTAAISAAGHHADTTTVHFYPSPGNWFAPALADPGLWKNGANWRELAD
jgi:hypothetical protein